MTNARYLSANLIGLNHNSLLDWFIAMYSFVPYIYIYLSACRTMFTSLIQLHCLLLSQVTIFTSVFLSTYNFILTSNLYVFLFASHIVCVLKCQAASRAILTLINAEIKMKML